MVSKQCSTYFICVQYHPYLISSICFICFFLLFSLVGLHSLRYKPTHNTSIKLHLFLNPEKDSFSGVFLLDEHSLYLEEMECFIPSVEEAPQRSLLPSAFSSVQFSCSVVSNSLWITARQASLSITNSQSSPKLMSIKSVMTSSHLLFCHPLLLLPPIPPSIRVFSNESPLHMRWPKYWSFSFRTSPSNEHPGLISFRMDWLDLLEVQGTLKSLLQHHSSKA